jgi:hypothetical protein
VAGKLSALVIGGQTLVTSLAEVELNGGVFGRPLTPLVKLMSARLGAESMASLKYLVEHGHPYQGAQPLPSGPATC